MCKAKLSKHLYGLFIFLCVICLFPVFPLTANGASLADLAGTWNYNSFVSGPAAPWWERGTLTVKPNGTFTGSGKESNGNPDSFSGVFSISSDVIVMTGCGYSDTPLCQIDLGNTVLVCTHISGDGSSNLTIFTKQAASYSMADLVGNWEANYLSSGPTPWCARMSDTTYLDGTYKGTLTLSDGPSTGTFGQMSISPTGVITCLFGDCLSSPNNYTAFMSANKTVSVGTSGAASGQDAQLSVFTKQAASYSMADLAGSWQGSSLASGPGAPWWERDIVTINADGTFTVSWTGSDGSSGTGTGTLSISSTGVIACVSGDCTDRTYMSFMDAGKTVTAGTHTWPDGATREIKIFTKDSVPDAPTGVTAAAGDAYAAVSFNAPASTGGSPIQSYLVTSYPGGNTATGLSSPITVGGLTNGGAYTFRVAATNAKGTGPMSAESNSVTLKPTGSLTVTISPQAVITAGAMWRVDGGAWQISGATVAGLSVGSHKVTFKAVTGWNTPAGQTVKILNGQTTSASGLYVQQTGSVTVTITPAAAVKAGAMWCVTAPGSEDCGQPSFDGPWQKNGATVSSLALGIHTIGFNAVAGWTAPQSQTVELKLGKNEFYYPYLIYQMPSFGPKSASCGHLSGGCKASPCECGTYCPSCSDVLGICDLFKLTLSGTACGAVGAQFTSFQGNTGEASLVLDCGGWSPGSDQVYNGDGPALCVRERGGPECAHVKIGIAILSSPGEDACDGNLGSIQSSVWGEVVEPNLPGGSEFISDKGYWPATSFHCPGSGKPSCGSLTVTISPAAAVSAGAQWNVDGGTWQNSGATVGQLSAGNHTVNFNTISGWTSPASQTVKIVVGQTASATGTYVAQATPLSFRSVSAQCVYASGGCPPPYPNMGFMVYTVSGSGTACGPSGATVELSISELGGTIACDQWTANPATMSCMRGSGQQECTTVNFTGQNVGGPNGCPSFDPQETATVNGLVNGVYSSTGPVHIPMCCQGSQGSCGGGSAAGMRRLQQK